MVVDSRTRVDPESSTAANYEVALPHRIDGAVQLRLGDFALGGSDSRLAIDTRRRHLRFCLGVAAHAASTMTVGGTVYTIYPATSSRLTDASAMGFSGGSVTYSGLAPHARAARALRALGYPVHLVQDQNNYGIVGNVTLPQTFTYTGTLNSSSDNYVYVLLPYLTVTEMVLVLDRILGSEFGVRVRWDSATQEVVWTSPSTIQAISAPEHSLLWYLGVDSVSGGFPARTIPRCIRTLELPVQTPANTTDLAQLLRDLWMPENNSSLTLSTGITSTSFTFPDSASYPARIVSQFDGSSLYTAGYRMTFTYPRFTISREDGVPFSIEFGDDDFARFLGFSTDYMLMGASSYTSNSQDIPIAAQGLLSDSIEARQPRRRLRWSADSSARLQCIVEDIPHLGVLEIDGTDTGAPREINTTATLSGQTLHGIVEGDVFLHQATVSSVADNFGMYVTAISADGTTFSFITRRNGTTAAIGGGLAAILPNRPASLLRLRNLAGELLGGTSSGISAADLVLTHRGAHWPCNEVIGIPSIGSVTLPALLPGAPRLAPPEYVLMVLDDPTGAFRSTSHASTNGRSRVFGVLARIVLSEGLVRETSIDTSFADLSRVVDLERVRVRFLEPLDHAEVDWHGREHSWTLLIKTLA